MPGVCVGWGTGHPASEAFDVPVMMAEWMLSEEAGSLTGIYRQLDRPCLCAQSPPVSVSQCLFVCPLSSRPVSPGLPSTAGPLEEKTVILVHLGLFHSHKGALVE